MRSGFISILLLFFPFLGAKITGRIGKRKLKLTAVRRRHTNCHQFLKTPTDGSVEQRAGKSRRLHRPKNRNRENQFSKAAGKNCSTAQRENKGFNFWQFSERKG